MRTLLFCPTHEGHHFVFAKLLISMIAQLGSDVVLVATPEGSASKEFKMHLQPLSAQFEMDNSLMLSASGPSYRMTQVREFRRALARHRPQRVLAPAGDALLPLMGVYSRLGMGRVPKEFDAEFALIRANFGYTAISSSERVRFWAKERSIAAAIRGDPLMLIDPVAYEHIQRRGSPLAGKIRLVPEPLDEIAPISRQEGRRRLSLPEDGHYVGCVGMLDTRKGIDRLIRAFAAAPVDSTDKLLLAGVTDGEVGRMVDGEFRHLVTQGRILLLRRYLTDEELNWAICCMDVVAATYWTAHSAPSGIVNRAAVLGRPVLASRFGWSDFMVPEFGLGRLTDINNPATFGRDIAAALADSGSFRQSPKTARLREFLSPANFAASWTANIARQLGQPVTNLKTWDWVMGRESTGGLGKSPRNSINGY